MKNTYYLNVHHIHLLDIFYFKKINEHNVNFNLMNISDEMICMFTSNECVKVLSKSCYDKLNQRRALFFNVLPQVRLYTICFKNIYIFILLLL